MAKTKVVNFYGGPGTGKSTMTAAVFAELKWAGFNAEIASEYAKRKVWEGSTTVLDDQKYVFGKQFHTQKILDGNVDVMISDSPLLFSIIYDSEDDMDFQKMVTKSFKEFDNINIFLHRVKPYNPSGRMQTEEEAIALDRRIKNMLNNLGESYVEFDGCKESVEAIAQYVMSQLATP